MAKIRGYSWPGNVREIQAVVQRALLHADTVVRADDLDIPEAELTSSAEPMPLERFAEAKARVIETFEREYLTKLLASCEGNVTRADRVFTVESGGPPEKPAPR